MPEHTKRKFYKRPLFIVPAVLAVLVVGGIAIGANKKSVLEFSSSVVERIDLTQSVEETGSIVADLELEYGWETSGRVAAVLKKEGDILKKNDVEFAGIFGSYARGEAEEESDIDVLMVLEDFRSLWEEIQLNSELVAEICLKYGVVISLIPVKEINYNTRKTPLILNVKKTITLRASLIFWRRLEKASAP